MEDIRMGTLSKLIDGRGLFLSLKNIKTLLEYSQEIGNHCLYCTYNGRILCPDVLKDLPCDVEWHVRTHVRVLGGKGGFGSMLRAIGAQIEKTTNREACRDLSGRRMRDVNNEKAINDWLEKQKAEEEDKAKRKKEKLEKILNPPRHIVNDSTYVSEIKENAEKIDEALKQGLQKLANPAEQSSSIPPIKRSLAADQKPRSKKQRLWLEFDSDESLDDEEAEKERSLGDVASPVEQTEGKSSPCSPRNKKYLASISKDSPTVLDVENANVDQPSATDTDDTAMKKDCSEDNQLEEKAGNEKGVKQIASTLDDAEVIDLQSASRAEDLEVYGLERLKSELMKHGLKCGGTLKHRAERLFLLKNTPIENLDKSLFAKASKKQPK